MSFDPSKVVRLEIGFTLVALPLTIWLAIYMAVRLWSINPRPILPWLNILRWLDWGLGLVLMLIHWTNDHFPFTYGIAVLTFSAGLAIPQSWVKRRFAPDLLEPSGDWWPSKRE